MNTLNPVPLFATPKDMEQFQTYLEQFHSSEGVVAMTCAFMGWNLACKYQQENNREICEKLELLLERLALERTQDTNVWGLLPGVGEAYDNVNDLLVTLKLSLPVPNESQQRE